MFYFQNADAQTIQSNNPAVSLNNPISQNSRTQNQLSPLLLANLFSSLQSCNNKQQTPQNPQNILAISLPNNNQAKSGNNLAVLLNSPQRPVSKLLSSQLQPQTNIATLSSLLAKSILAEQAKNAKQTQPTISYFNIPQPIQEKPISTPIAVNYAPPNNPANPNLSTILAQSQFLNSLSMGPLRNTISSPTNYSPYNPPLPPVPLNNPTQLTSEASKTSALKILLPLLLNLLQERNGGNCCNPNCNCGCQCACNQQKTEGCQNFVQTPNVQDTFVHPIVPHIKDQPISEQSKEVEPKKSKLIKGEEDISGSEEAEYSNEVDE